MSHTAEPPVLVRAEDHLDVPVGAVLTDEDGHIRRVLPKSMDLYDEYRRRET